MKGLASRHRKSRRVMAVVLAVGAACAIGVARYTDRSEFCGSSCHEMGPYHAAWSAGPHRSVACVECHVDSGLARLGHKVIALKELAVHLAGEVAFPGDTPPDVPDARCVRCHRHVDPGIPGFDHAEHADGTRCQTCHAEIGHEATADALRAAGVLDESNVATTSVAQSPHPVVNGGAANLDGHVKVVCSRCHNLAITPCSTCHTAKHAYRGECSTCHRPGTDFVFSHPKKDLECTACHELPKHHVDTDRECGDCHRKPGVSWAFSHPSESDCETCHNRPAGHRKGTCATCHTSPGKSWKFHHPAAGSDCGDCHERPAGTPDGSCSRCHVQAGVSWAFRHPTVAGGRHTYRSFRCSKCHPGGYLSHTCTACH